MVSFANALARIKSLREHVDFMTLLLFLFPLSLLWGLMELIDEVVEGDSRTFDEQVIVSLRNPGDLSDPLGPLWLEEIMRDLTALGGIAILTLLVLSVGGYFLHPATYLSAFSYFLSTVSITSGVLQTTELVR